MILSIEQERCMRTCTKTSSFQRQYVAQVVVHMLVGQQSVLLVGLK